MLLPRVMTILCFLALGGTIRIEPSDFDESQTITRDVCVIGGGAGGTYAAIRLRQLNHTVAVVEKNKRLGGHTETYFDPATNTPVDYGVLFYHNLSIVHDFFGYFGLSLTTVAADGGGGTPRPFDFRTGEPVDDAPSQGDVVGALTRYAEQLVRYPFLNMGFNLPDPVPEDLLLPFGEFVKKYDLAAAVDIIALYVQGVGDVLRLQTIYVMKYFSLEVIEGLPHGYLQEANHNNGALYMAAQKELGDDVVFESTIARLDRDSDPDWVRIVVQKKTDGSRQLIKARQIIVAIPPKLDALDGGFDLDDQERSLFGQFSSSCLYTALAHIKGLPPGNGIINRATDTPYHIPRFPGIYILKPTGVPDLYDITYGSDDPLDEDGVKADMSQAVQHLQSGDLNASTPEFVVYALHEPFEMVVSSEAIRNGFYGELQGLQGHRRTFYTGATFDTPNSSLIWRFTEALLQNMLKGRLLSTRS